MPALVAWILSALCAPAHSQEASRPPSHGDEVKLSLEQAVMCEAVRDYAPLNQGVVFPTSMGKVLCFTSFDPVPQKTVIYHNWFHRDQLSNKQRLGLQPPRWSTFSSIQLRETDKGPWRVEITDSAGQIIRVLRFSITD